MLLSAIVFGSRRIHEHSTLSASLALIAVLFLTAGAAAIPPLFRAIRVDPVQTRRSE